MMDHIPVASSVIVVSAVLVLRADKQTPTQTDADERYTTLLYLFMLIVFIYVSIMYLLFIW